MILTIVTYVIIILFILLWAHASLPKLSKPSKFREILITQAIPQWMPPVLTWLLPIIEIGTIVLLVINETRLIGMYVSLIMMAAFTVYVSGIIFKVYDIYPCPCGGIFSDMGWKKHFKVNIILTVIALIGIVLLRYKY